MKGSIRFVVGLVLVLGAVGGMDNADIPLLYLLPVAIAGLLSMYSATKAMEH